MVIAAIGLDMATPGYMTKQNTRNLGQSPTESARRPKSDWEKLEEKGKIFPASKSRGPNSNALAYAERALST